ncbi:MULTISPECIES: hypothetical protein [Paraburkholderia]|uniref:Uncharacterized protein n=2 Tax=Paraburkholderia TaxID=1822464 RepID=A0A6J5G2W2_9BURK|nr:MULTISPECIES: hypothetical protein [Paraburkholderia]RKT25596.1 hypothetical protein B0G69_1314 [Paraburkholderia sp. RAU2J]CAB3790208.1 hypothetical protein LMG27177_02771 [Paraburkholderia fynbosensis]
MPESLIAYLLGPAVMIVIGLAIWAASLYHRTTKPPRLERWLDTHYAEWLHQKH